MFSFSTHSYSFDATENDIPSTTGISVQGYPTLKFKPAGSKEWIDYDDERELDAMIAFVEKNSVNKVKAVKVELPEPVEGGDGADQVVFDSEETEPVPEDEDNDAEHDEL
jgi:protein disulfide-isomerase A1